ncbi:MAG: flagellar basal body L-ring protein FlgH [Deltaproteobacteria bacterium]|nr:flagellar basal body L-ring protein FlgH [Deltaproteobacteria bacterium]
MGSLFSGSLLTACGPAHVTEFTPKKRVFDVVKAPEKTSAENDGSLWSREGNASNLFADARAYRIADIVVVEVEEKADANRSSDTDILRDSNSGVGFTALPVIGPLASLALGDMSVDVSGNGKSDSGFKSNGRTGRTESLMATVPVVVQQVLPNGNLIVEGHRVVLVNQEEQHLYVSGIVRPIDIDQNNAVKSSKLAEAEIEFVGVGILTDNAKQGWFSRYFGWIWPF